MEQMFSGHNEKDNHETFIKQLSEVCMTDRRTDQVCCGVATKIITFIPLSFSFLLHRYMCSLTDSPYFLFGFDRVKIHTVAEILFFMIYFNNLTCFV